MIKTDWVTAFFLKTKLGWAKFFAQHCICKFIFPYNCSPTGICPTGIYRYHKEHTVYHQYRISALLNLNGGSTKYKIRSTILNFWDRLHKSSERPHVTQLGLWIHIIEVDSYLYSWLFSVGNFLWPHCIAATTHARASLWNRTQRVWI